jgi:sporulation protein YlmC with PRC-barrel domain
MKNLFATVALGLLCAAALSTADAQQPVTGQSDGHVAGMSPIGVTVTSMNAVVLGWSAKKAILGKAVMNEQRQKIGKIDDIIVTPENSVSFAIVGTGGFLGMGKHDVAIPMNQLRNDNNDFVLPGATKEALKALPAFEYRKGK